MKKILNLSLIFVLIGCANIVAPTGGEKDINPSRVLRVDMIENNKEYKVIVFEFDEYIQLNKWEQHFYISPTINSSVQKKIKKQKLFLTIEDTLKENTTYHVALNNCIKDNNEGNILDSLTYNLSTGKDKDTLTLTGNLLDAYTLAPLENAWVMLFQENIDDSVIFKGTPNYISKTDNNGIFYFPNLKNKKYKIVALTDFDFIYNKGEKIAFSNRIIDSKIDSFISLFGFDQIIENKDIYKDSILMQSDVTQSSSLDSILQDDFLFGKLEIISVQNRPLIFQLLQNEKVIIETPFFEKPYLIDGIEAGKYQLKCILDNNEDSIWNTGNWDLKIQPEKVVNYPSEIIIRSNWDLQLDWIILK